MSTHIQNAFLQSLDHGVFSRLSEQLTECHLGHGVRVQWNEAPTEWVYFPVSSLLSNIAADSAVRNVETSMGGNEGASGLIEACSSGVSSVDCIVQVDGMAWRSPADWCRQLVSSDPSFGFAAWRIAELQLIESRQSALCQAMHKAKQRFARWILESFERSGGRNPLPLTQEFLADMIGVQRTTVTAMAAQLQQSGAIRYRRGQLEMLDRGALETLACDCHELAKRQRKRLGLSAPPPRGPWRPGGQLIEVSEFEV